MLSEATQLLSIPRSTSATRVKYTTHLDIVTYLVDNQCGLHIVGTAQVFAYLVRNYIHSKLNQV